MADDTPPVDKDSTPLNLAALSCAIHGCNCTPEIEVSGTVGAGEIVDIHISHDDWCALLQRRSRRSN